MQIALIALLVLLSLVLLLAVLLLIAPFATLFRYDKARGDNGLIIVFKFMGIKVWSNSMRSKSKGKPGQRAGADFFERLFIFISRKKKARQKAPHDDDTGDKDNKKSPFAYLPFIRDAIKIAGRFTPGLRLTRLTLHFDVKGEDAAETAIAYGRISTAIYTALAVLQNQIDIPQPDISIDACFDGEKRPPKIYISLRSSGYNNLRTLLQLFILYRNYYNLFS